MKPTEKVGPCAASIGKSEPRSDIAYMASLLTELKNMSNKSGDRLLTYLIEMAESYAIELQHKKRPKQNYQRQETKT